MQVLPITPNQFDQPTSPETLFCIPATDVHLADVPLGQVDARAGRASFDFLNRAMDLLLQGSADAVVTAPIHKQSLHLAHVPYPGHTEILAAKTGAGPYAMMLYGRGLAVSHVTLHIALREAVAKITTTGIAEKIQLTHDWLCEFAGHTPRLGVCAMNPHASDGGLMGDEEARLILPAVQEMQAKGIHVTGPWPSDTLFSRATRGEFQGIVAMYHDQGHIPMKLWAGMNLVNVTLGLPILRTSVAHGTAFDIASQFRADPSSLLEAIRVASQWVQQRRCQH